MSKKYYFVLLALRGYTLLAIKGSFIVSKQDNYYVFWYFERPFKRLTNVGKCSTKYEALFKWQILMKEVI